MLQIFLPKARQTAEQLSSNLIPVHKTPCPGLTVTSLSTDGLLRASNNPSKHRNRYQDTKYPTPAESAEYRPYRPRWAPYGGTGPRRRHVVVADQARASDGWPKVYRADLQEEQCYVLTTHETMASVTAQIRPTIAECELGAVVGCWGQVGVVVEIAEE